jgi:hypothetical protein
MASTTAVAERVTSGLALVESDVRGLPNLADEWEQLGESARVSLSLEWAHSMADYLTELDEQYHADRMTPGQQERYQALLRDLRTALPTINRLNLYGPPICLEP